MSAVKQVERSGHTNAASEQSSTSLLRALQILELVAQKSGGLSNGEISRRLKIATSTTSYILSRLEREGYIKRSGERGRYEIGLKVVALAHGALREMGLRRAAEPILHRLVAETRRSALVAVLERGLVMIVDKVEQPDLVKLDMDIGVRYPVHTTALGKVLLAGLEEQERNKLFEGNTSTQMLRQALATKPNLVRELEVVKKRGYAVSDGELFLGVWAISAPIVDAAGVVRAAVSATGAPRPVDDRAMIDSVVRCARDISVRLAAAESAKLPRQ
jgi:DNA-binding IclR family transcriptional regulator